MANSDTIVQDRIEEVIKVEEPKKYKVIIHNDNTTTFDFVVRVLRTIFGKTEEEAAELTKMVHFQGQAIAGVYTREIAEEKTTEATIYARGSGFPLTFTFEEA